MSGQTPTPDAECKIKDIILEYQIVIQLDLAKNISEEYQCMALLYERVIRHSTKPVDKSDPTWNSSFNEPCKSLKRILVLFIEEQSYVRDTSKFCNPKTEKISITVEGKPNQACTQSIRSFEQYDEICKYFSERKQRDANANEVQKHLALHDLGVGAYLTGKYASWVDFRMTDLNTLHRTGREIGSEGGGITLQIEKKPESAGSLNTYIYLIMDAQLNIQNGAFVSAIY